MAINARQAYERYFEFTALSVPESWRRQSGSSPADLHYYHAMNHYKRTGLWDNHFSSRNDQQQFELDVAMWYGSLTRGSAAEVAFLKRVFTVLYHGGMFYKGVVNWQTWASSDIPIAAAISHGGRVLIQLPKASGIDAEGFFNWLDGGDKIISSNSRLAATHGIEPLSYVAMQPLGGGHRHRVNEVKKGDLHYGVNIGLGGSGNYNPFSGNRIAANGEHGHLYVFYRAPTADDYGGLLIGCEGSAPIDSWDNRDSVFHTRGGSGRSGYAGVAGLAVTALLRDKVLSDPTGFTPDQTGGYHKFGDRQRYSPTGNGKWEDLGVGPRQVYNGMIVDLVETGWDFLKPCSFNPDDLGNSGPAPTPVTRPPWPRILTHTCITEANLAKMKSLMQQAIRDRHFHENNMPVMQKDYNAPKAAKHMAPKPLEQINFGVSQVAGGLHPDSQEPMSYEAWAAFSNVRFSSRGTRIQLVDQALRRCLEGTSWSLREVRKRESVSDVPSTEGMYFKPRYNLVIELLRIIQEYIGSLQEKSSLRAEAAVALSTLIKVELKHLSNAKLEIEAR